MQLSMLDVTRPDFASNVQVNDAKYSQLATDMTCADSSEHMMKYVFHSVILLLVLPYM